MDEFELIRRYFSRASADPDVLIGVGDDGAVLRPAPGRDQVQVLDTLVEGIHYPDLLPAADIGYRAVAVNLSDIAAMGARPRWMTLALTLCEAEAGWLDDFAAGLYEAADPYGVTLVGGDTTRGPRTVVSVNLTGDVEPGRALTRAGARPGDRIYLSGSAGDASAGLALMTAGARPGPAAQSLIERFRRPAPRIALGRRLGTLASAAIDVSDGLYGDTAKLLAASGVAGTIHVDRLPLSDGLVAVVGRDQAVAAALGGGDDYELCFTAPPAADDALAALAAELEVPLTAIGEVRAGSGLVCRDRGADIGYRDAGYLHFGAGAA